MAMSKTAPKDTPEQFWSRIGEAVGSGVDVEYINGVTTAICEENYHDIAMCLRFTHYYIAEMGYTRPKSKTKTKTKKVAYKPRAVKVKTTTPNADTPKKKRGVATAPIIKTKNWRDFPLTSIIKIQQENPKKINSMCYDRYDATKGATTLAEYFELSTHAGRGKPEFNYDYARGYIVVEGDNEEEEEVKEEEDEEVKEEEVKEFCAPVFEVIEEEEEEEVKEEEVKPIKMKPKKSKKSKKVSSE